MSRYTKEEHATALVQLREILKPGMTISCVLRNVSRSGMSRSISLFAPLGADGMRELDYLCVRALGASYDPKRGGVRVTGCGMDMGFHLVYNLSTVLFPHGFGCIGEKCPASDHSNGERDYTPHSCGEPLTFDEKTRAPLTWQRAPGGKPARVAHWHSCGGYALRSRWM